MPLKSLPPEATGKSGTVKRKVVAKKEEKEKATALESLGPTTGSSNVTTVSKKKNNLGLYLLIGLIIASVLVALDFTPVVFLVGRIYQGFTLPILTFIGFPVHSWQIGGLLILIALLSFALGRFSKRD